jgi:hypothetical protein
LSIIYTKLGVKFKERKLGVDLSYCELVVPVNLSPGYYVSALDQKVLFGLSKSKGVDVEFFSETNFARRANSTQSDPRDLRKTIARVQLAYGAGKEVVKALEEITMPLVHVRPGKDDSEPFERMCARNRKRELNFHSFTKVRVVKNRPEAQVSIAVDGQDLRLETSNLVSRCP